MDIKLDGKLFNSLKRLSNLKYLSKFVKDASPPFTANGRYKAALAKAISLMLNGMCDPFRNFPSKWVHNLNGQEILRKGYNIHF